MSKSNTPPTTPTCAPLALLTADDALLDAAKHLNGTDASVHNIRAAAIAFTRAWDACGGGR